MTQEFEVLWNTNPVLYLPHQQVFSQHNPHVRQHVSCGVKSTWKEGWRNADRNIRNWWQKNSHKVRTQKLLTLEYDVYCNININLSFPESGVAGRDIWEPGTSPFYYFNEIKLLPEEIRGSACAVAPLAVTLWDRDALDAIADHRWDFLFKQDLFSELRIGTLVRHLGFPVLHAQGLHNANYMSRKVNEGPGIYHAVKQKIQS